MGIFRIDPQLPTDAMKTYSIMAPKSTHFRKATCAEMDCPSYLHGWATIIDERTELGQEQAHYIRKLSGRKFTEGFQFETDSHTGVVRPNGQPASSSRRGRPASPPTRPASISPNCFSSEAVTGAAIRARRCASTSTPTTGSTISVRTSSS